MQVLLYRWITIDASVMHARTTGSVAAAHHAHAAAGGKIELRLLFEKQDVLVANQLDPTQRATATRERGQELRTKRAPGICDGTAEQFDPDGNQFGQFLQ